MSESKQALKALCHCIHESIAPYAGRVEYGNLRSQVSDWEGEDGVHTNIALVYETPGGSTDQINVSFHHGTCAFSLIDHSDEVTTDSVDVVLKIIMPRVSGIPEKRLDSLKAEIRREIDGGKDTAGLYGHLNRILQSEFKGGKITHIEMRDAITYAVKYAKTRASA
jgi:hypothetical protein